MKNIDVILKKLEKIKQNRNDSWQALCPIHADKDPSLTITEKENGTILLYCHAGCKTKKIMDTLNLPMTLLFPEKNNNKRDNKELNLNKPHTIEEIKSWKNTKEVYTYYTAEKKPYMLVRRKTTGAKCSLYRYENGMWVSGLHNLQPILYRLPELIQIIKTGINIFIVEGEKDAENLRKLGFTATTNPMGAGKWKHEYNSIFTNAIVSILYDNDEPGKKHAEDIANNLLPIAKEIKIITLPGVKEKEDISDWLQSGGTKEQLLNLVNNTPVWLKQNNQIKIFNFAEIQSMTTNIEQNAVINDLLYRECVSIFFGEPGIGKTWLILDLCLKLADGKPIWNKYHTTAKKILLLESDFSTPILTYRFKHISSCKNIKNFMSITTQELERLNIDYSLNKKLGQEIIEKLIEQSNPDLIVIDSLANFLDGDESKFTDVKPAIDFLRNTATKYKSHIMIIHHARKRSSIERRDRRLDMSDMIGSSLLMRYASNIFGVNSIYDDEDKMENKGLIVNIKNWFKLIPTFEYHIQEDDNEMINIDYNFNVFLETKTKVEQAKDVIVDLLNTNQNQTLSQEDILNQTNFKKATIKRALNELIDTKRIESIGYTQNRKYKIK